MHQPEPAPSTLSLALNMGNCPFSNQDTAQSHLALSPQPPCASCSMGCLQAQEDASADGQSIVAPVRCYHSTAGLRH